tara:strand:- start:591 stop:1409 length:819 start_codon:yes stop_codon:yes gene_type:complete
MKKLFIFILIFIHFFIFYKNVYATGKSEYNPINSSSYKYQRDISADRPDFTESPYTLNAGTMQLESSFFDFSQKSDVNTWSIHPFNFKIGLNNSIDAQLLFEPYIKQDFNKEENSGNGDLQIRIKKNIWGNDIGKSAFGFMPFIKLPVADDNIGNNKVEGGIIFPFSKNISDTVNLGLMFQTDLVYDDDEKNFDTEFIISSVLGIDIQRSLGFYSEIIFIKSNDIDYKLSNIIGFGATYSLSENLIFDIGLNHRLLGNKDDFNIFSGYTFRY